MAKCAESHFGLLSIFYIIASPVFAEASYLLSAIEVGTYPYKIFFKDDIPGARTQSKSGCRPLMKSIPDC